MEDKSFELLTQMYSEMKEQFAVVNGRINDMQSEVKTISNQVAKFENDLKPKVEAALDGYKQHTDVLERIEKEVTKQEEIIMRRIK